MGRLLGGLREEKIDNDPSAIFAILRFGGPSPVQESQESQKSHGVGGEKPIPMANPTESQNRRNRRGSESEKTHSAPGRVTAMRHRLLAAAKAAVIDAEYVALLSFDELLACAGKTDDELRERLCTLVRGHNVPTDDEMLADDPLGLPVSEEAGINKRQNRCIALRPPSPPC